MLIEKVFTLGLQFTVYILVDNPYKKLPSVGRGAEKTGNPVEIVTSGVKPSSQ